MTRISASSVAAVVITAAITFSALSTTIFAQTAPPPTYTVGYGVDRPFEVGEFNFWDTLEECGSGAACIAGPDSGGFVESIADLRSAGTLKGESVTGVQYQLTKLCNAQNVTLPFYADFTFTYGLATDYTLVSGDAIASINLRSQTPDELVISSAFSIDGSGDTDSSTTPLTRSIEIHPELDTLYQTSLGARSEAYVLTSTSLGEFARAEAEANVAGITLRFGDSTPPETDAFLTPATGVADTVVTGFQGWYKSPPSLTVDAFDPMYVNQDLIAHSCVNRAEIEDVRRPQAERALPSLAFGPEQSPETTSYSTLQRYDLEILAVDNNGVRDPTPVKLSYGIDDQKPLVWVNVTPATPTGRDGWYNSADAAKFVITCDDSNGLTSGNYSGCRYTNYTRSDGSSWARQTITNTRNVAIVEGEAVWLSADAVDKVYNQGLADTSTEVKVDVTPPKALREVSVPSSPYSPSWWNKTVTVTFACDALNETLSGCFGIQTRLNSSGSWTNTTSHTFDKHAKYTVNVKTEDNATNNGFTDHGIYLDLLPPLAPPNLRLTTAYNEVDGHAYSGVIPKWAWDPATDAGSNVRHYKVYFDGVFSATKWSWDRTYTAPLDVTDGWHTVGVAAVDNAANEGALVEHRVFIDRGIPTTVFQAPEGGKITFWDGSQQNLSSAYNDWAIFLRGFWLNASTTDAAPSSGIVRTRIIDHSVNGAEIPCTVETTTTCAHEVPTTAAGSGGYTHYVAEGQGTDRADNMGTDNRTVLRVDVGVFRQLEPTGLGAASEDSSTPPEGLVYWKPHTTSGFVEYRIHRSTSENFVPRETDLLSEKATLVQRVSDQWSTKWTDTNIEWDESTQTWKTYYYKVVVKYSFLGLVLDWITHETRMPYGSAEISMPVACGSNSCT